MSGDTPLVRDSMTSVEIDPDRDKIGTVLELDSVRSLIEMDDPDNGATVLMVGTIVVPVEVAAVTAGLVDDAAFVMVVVLTVVTNCISLVSICCFGSVVNIDVTDDDDGSDSCAVIVVVAMGSVSDGSFTSNDDYFDVCAIGSILMK